jgi:hypothetical protein
VFNYIKEKKCTNKDNIEALSREHCCHRKAIIITSERVLVALGIRHGICVRHIILSHVDTLGLPYFSKLSRKRTIFGKQLLNTKRVFSFSLHTLSKTFLILRRIQRCIILNVYRA